MPRYRRKIGEKATLVSKCGESLFGCCGEMLVTQGIYVPKSLSSRPSHCICKRTVWVPDSISYECFFHYLDYFGASFPFPIQRGASHYCFGLCGINPTRTMHAEGNWFFIVVKYLHRRFAVYGIVQTKLSSLKSVAFIENISTNKNDVLNCVDWIQREIACYKLSKVIKSNGADQIVLKDATSDQKDQMYESESQIVIQEAQQDQVQHKCDETESEVSFEAPESFCPAPCECLQPLNTSFNGVNLPSPNTLFWVLYYPQQSTVDVAGYPNTFPLTQSFSFSKPFL